MFKEMEYVYEVYKEKSFSKAAEKMFISQPALSKMVKKAEAEIGCPIFDRSTIPLTVTKDGMYYIRSIEQIYEIKANVESYFGDIGELNEGTISLGGSSYFCSFVFPELISRFNRRYPNIKFNLQEGNITELKQGLMNSSLDLVLETALQNDKDVENFLYKKEHIILAVPKQFEINKRLQPYQLSNDDIIFETFMKKDVEAVPLAAFRDVPFIKMKPGNDMCERSKKICRNAGFEMKASMNVDQVMTSLNIASTGIGALFVRSDIVRYLPEHENIIFYKINDPLAERKVMWSVKKGKYLPKAVSEFIRMSEYSRGGIRY